ncbi:putative ribonuclease H-like domain-containing protein [Tanacetum coccineum]
MVMLSSPDDGFKPLSDGEKKVDGVIQVMDDEYMVVLVVSDLYHYLYDWELWRVRRWFYDSKLYGRWGGEVVRGGWGGRSWGGVAGGGGEVWGRLRCGGESGVGIDVGGSGEEVGVGRVERSWVNGMRNKKDERGIVIKKSKIGCSRYTQEEGIDYDEVFAPIARIEAIRLFLAYALFKDFVVYQMDVNSAFLYGKIEEEVYVCQPPGFEDPDFPDRVYKVEKALYGLHQAPRAWYETLSAWYETLSTYSMSSMGELTFFLGLPVKQKKDGIFISQDKYVAEILKKFGFSEVKTASTPMETQKPLLKDEDGKEVDVHLYRSMIGSLMYLTSSRPDIMFAVCACARYQVNPKVSHLHVVKKIFRYLKGQPKLGLWYPKDSPFDLVAYTDSDYAGASLDRKSTTRGCQFLGSRR